MTSTFSDALRSLLRRCHHRPKLRRFLTSLLPPADVAYADCVFRTHPADNYTEFFLWFHGMPPEHKGTAFLRGMFAKRRITMVDVGANAGVFSLPIARVAAPESTFILFEPNPVLLRRLAKNIGRNGLTNVRVLDHAVGDEETRAVMYFPQKRNFGQGRLGIPYPSSKRKVLSVAVRPLAQCLEELGVERLDLLKVDVEGLEDRVILPLIEADAAPKPDFIYFEDAHEKLWKVDLEAALGHYGYSLVKRFGPNAFYRRG